MNSHTERMQAESLDSELVSVSRNKWQTDSSDLYTGLGPWIAKEVLVVFDPASGRPS